VNLQLIKAEDGVERFLALVQDISALKQAEENLNKFNAPVERWGAGQVNTSSYRPFGRLRTG
jgi:hypothetical protein